MSISDYIQKGDRVVDPMDNSVRTVDFIGGTTVYMTDGGCMGVDEVKHCFVYLPSEPIEVPFDKYGSLVTIRPHGKNWVIYRATEVVKRYDTVIPGLWTIREFTTQEDATAFAQKHFIQ